MKLSNLFNAPTLVEYSELWLNSYKAGIRTNTKRNYTNIIRKFNKDNVPITKVTKKTYLNILEGEPDYTKTRIALTFKQVIRCAIADKYLKPDAMEEIFRLVTLPKPQSKPRRVLTVEENKAVYRVELKDMDKAYLWIIFGCGLRREEALALTSMDVTDEGLNINKTLVFNSEGNGIIEQATKSQNSRRVVPIPSFLREFLNEYIKGKTYLFTNSRTGGLMTIGSFQEMYRRIQKAMSKELDYKFELTSHNFRHNYCSNLCYQIPTISIKTVAMLLGDTVDVALHTYNHILSEREDKLGAIENALKF